MASTWHNDTKEAWIQIDLKPRLTFSYMVNVMIIKASFRF